jgi:hypothetical protein
MPCITDSLQEDNVFDMRILYSWGCFAETKTRQYIKHFSKHATLPGRDICLDGLNSEKGYTALLQCTPRPYSWTCLVLSQSEGLMVILSNKRLLHHILSPVPSSEQAHWESYINIAMYGFVSPQASSASESNLNHCILRYLVSLSEFGFSPSKEWTETTKMRI